MILYVGRLCEQKGTDLLIAAYRMLKRPAALVVAGPCEQFGQTQLSALVAQIQEAGGIYLPPLDDADMPGIYNACDIFAMPTRELEMFGMAAVEAQACGKPVVASDHGGLRETVPQTAGTRFRTGDASGLGRPPGNAAGQPRFAGRAGSRRARKRGALRLASHRPALPGGLRRTMSAPLVSIAMPFYNAERTIGASIRSILLQSHSNWELLLCDDGSTDASRELARAFNDPRIVVWGDHRRLQLGARLNECIERARGDYVARMDADDIAYPRRLEKQLTFSRRPSGSGPDRRLGRAVRRCRRACRQTRRSRRARPDCPLAALFVQADPSHFHGKNVLVPALPLSRRCHPLRRPRSAVSGLRGQPVCQPAGDRAGLPARLHRFAEVLALALDVVPLRGALSGYAGRLRVGAVEALKSCRDVLAVAARADTAWLRSRYAALTEEELREWRQVWDSVS
jgi:glycosyltransferase involved in cell wall biosynthesis